MPWVSAKLICTDIMCDKSISELSINEYISSKVQALLICMYKQFLSRLSFLIYFVMVKETQ